MATTILVAVVALGLALWVVRKAIKLVVGICVIALSAHFLVTHRTEVAGAAVEAWGRIEVQVDRVRAIESR